MAERITLARPYAEAVFELAQERNQLAPWSDALRLAAVISADPRMAALIADPRVGRDRLVSLFLEIGGKNFTADAASVLRLLAANNRLSVLTEIAEVFDALKADAEQSIEADVVSAVPLKDQQLAQISTALKKRLKRDVQLKPQIDPALVGGLIIRAGDLVIDGSVTGQLRALSSYLTR